MAPETAAARAARKQEKRSRAAVRGEFLSRRAGPVDRAALRRAMADLDQSPGPAVAPSAFGSAATVFPATDTDRWVPIGPTVVRNGQAEARPATSGRIRDLAVHPDGTRAYAGTAKGGVWYTGDAGTTWEPLGGWASEARSQGGANNALSVGALLVSFGTDAAGAAGDFVMVGTGEPDPDLGPVAPALASVGVLAGTGPAVGTLQGDPWEAATGIAQLEGLGIYRLARSPSSTAGSSDPATQDTVAAATNNGLFLGTRSAGAFSWARVAQADTHIGGFQAEVTDLVWLPGGAAGRLFVAFFAYTSGGAGHGVAFTDDVTAGAPTFTWVTNLGPAVSADGRISLAANEDGTAVYALGERNLGSGPTATPTVWRIGSVTPVPAAAPTATILGGTPTNGQLWGTQRDYDQAIAVTTSGPVGSRVDRVHIGGSLVDPMPSGTSEWNASLWAFDVSGSSLVPAPGVSDVAAASARHGANLPGLIGNGVHPDVHTIRAAPAAAGSPQLWVGCDGGVFMSAQAGRTNTFLSRNVGLASVEVGFFAAHPTSSHFGIIGSQDNGAQVRVGDSVWQLTMDGDGGGVAFHPVHSQYVLAQWTEGTWQGRPQTGYRQPLDVADPDAESDDSAFYSGASAVATDTGTGRIALGTTRVWLTDNLGGGSRNTWAVLPYNTATPTAATNPRPGGGPSPARLANFGVPAGGLIRSAGLGSVITVKWRTDTSLLALYQRGIVRYDESTGSSGGWKATLLLPRPAVPGFVNPGVTPNTTLFTDIAPVPDSGDFYLTTTGVAGAPAVETCFRFDAAGTGRFRATGLAGVLAPIDPCYSVVVDPSAKDNIYVGTATGVWRGVRDAAGNHAWSLFANGLPEALVQDLNIWEDPDGDPASPRLLRAAIESRGVWEVDLSGSEPRRTYLRVHPRDDRRRFPTPMRNPRRRPTAPAVSALASPDVVIRPATPVAVAPAYRHTVLRAGNAPPYQVWTFQTAFRWRYPSIIANGSWSDMLGDLIERERALAGLPAGRFVDRALWDRVVGATTDEAGALAVYRAPWQSPAAATVPAGELDLMDTVIPRRDTNNVWQVYREPSIVEVLLHHRDIRPVQANASYAVLLWRASRSTAALRAADTSAFPAYARSLVGGGAADPVPAGWNVALAADGTPVHRLGAPLSARMPRAVPVPVDLSGLPAGNRVLLVALADSDPDRFATVPDGIVDTTEELVRGWPHAAARLISVWTRPR